jgi:acetate kinase
VRERICIGLEFLGVRLAPDRNAAQAPIISGDGQVTVRVMPTDEDVMIARHTIRLMSVRLKEGA